MIHLPSGIARRRLAFVGSSLICATVLLLAVGLKWLPVQGVENGTSLAAGLGPSQVVDLIGMDESLVLVVGGFYDTDAMAETAISGELSLGELEGFASVPVRDFMVHGEYRRSKPAFRAVDCVEFQADDPSRIVCEQLDTVIAHQVALRYVPLVEAAQMDLECSSVYESTISPPCTPRFEQVSKDSWMAVSAFRTVAGAREFIDLVHAIRGADVVGRLMIVRVTRIGGNEQIGLGQEAHPDGSGPLLDEIPFQAEAQTDVG